MIYLTTMSVAQANIGLEDMWQKASVTYVDVLLRDLIGGAEENNL
jgi:hypothetical protein